MTRSLESGQDAFLRCGGAVYLVQILGVSGNAIWVSFPDTQPPAVGAGVELDVDAGHSFTRYHALVTASSPNAPGLMLERSETASHRKQRREYRVPYEWEIPVVEAASGVQSIGRLVDVSGGGVRFASNETFEVGARLMLTIEWPDDFDYEYPVRVLYSKPPRPFHHTLGYGVRFEEMAPDAKQGLVAFLSREITRLYPKELKALYPGTRPRRKSK